MVLFRLIGKRVLAAMNTFDFIVILKAALREEGLSERDRVRADLDADHSSRRAHPRGEQIEAAAWTAADLQDAGAVRYSDLIEQAGRLMSELLGLALQTFLFRVPVAEDVAIACSHASPCDICPVVRSHFQ